MTDAKPPATTAAASAAPATPAAAPQPAATPTATPTANGIAVQRTEVRNVLTLTFFGVLIVLGTLIVFHYMTEYNRPKRELKAEMRAPEIQTDPAGNPGATGEWYLKRAREALNRRDTTSCRMMLDEAHDLLKQNKTALSPEGMQRLNDLELDLQAVLGPGAP